MTSYDTSFKKNGISGSALKIFAIFAMLIDHIGAIFLQPTSDTYYAFRLVGRIAFPIFCFLLVQGFFHTKNLLGYFLRLFLFALISEIPFDLAFSHVLFDRNDQNVFFTLLIGLMTISCMERVTKEFSDMPNICLICHVCITITGMLSAWYLKTDYGEIGVLSIVVLYIFHTNRQLASGISCLILCFLSRMEISSLASIPLILSYNGKRGISLKYVFYLFYPAHLLFLYILKFYFFA